MKQELISKKLLLTLSVFLVALGAGVAFVGNGNISQSLLSQFSGTNVTPANASSLWKPSAENPYRVKITETVSTRIDPVITRMLARGSTLSNEGYQVYLSNLVTGIAKIAAQSNYVNNVDIQNIVSYVSYELTDAKKLLANNNNIVADITNFFEGNEVMDGTNISGQSGSGTPVSASVAVSEVMNGGSFEQMFTSALNSETLNQGNITEEPNGSSACLLGVPLCTGNTQIKNINTVAGACPIWRCVAESTPACPMYLPPPPNSNYCPPSKVIASTINSSGCTVPPSCSQEATVNVNEWYSQVLGRTADFAGASYWFGMLSQTNNVSQTFASFVASARGVTAETINTAAVTTLTQKYSDPKYR